MPRGAPLTARATLRAARLLTGLPAGSVALLALPVLLGGCAATVAVAPPDPPPSGVDAARCAALQAALPATLEGVGRRSVDPPSATTAAWADPPIVLRCGVLPPAGLTPTSEVIEIDGVRWFAAELTGGYRFTTSDRTPRVEVTVPDAYRPEVNPLVDLGPAITASVPTTTGPATP